MKTTTDIETLIRTLFIDVPNDERRNTNQTLQSEYKIEDEEITGKALTESAKAFLKDKRNLAILKNVCELVEPFNCLMGLPWDDSANLKALWASVTATKNDSDGEDTDKNAPECAVATDNEVIEQAAVSDDSQITMEDNTMYKLELLIALMMGGVVGFSIGKFVEKKATTEKPKNSGHPNNVASPSSTKPEKSTAWVLQLLIQANRCLNPLIEGETEMPRLQQLITDSRAFRCRATGASVPTDDSKTIDWGQATNVLLTFNLKAAPVSTKRTTRGLLPGTNDTSYNYEYPDSAKSVTNLIRPLANASSIQLTTIAPCPKSPKALTAEVGFIAI